MAENQLNSLKSLTKVVADTGDFESMKAYKPQDATTNPSLILLAIKKPAYRPLLDQAIKDNENSSLNNNLLLRKILVDVMFLFGTKILDIVPGRVSIEIDARLSFDTKASIEMAHTLITGFEARGITRERILIKLASTWEGIEAAKSLQKEGINCNMTLLFSLIQAARAAEVGAKLISPFVGRILDWYTKDDPQDYMGAKDPGVQSVKNIYHYYKHFDYSTEIMGASFRNTSEIIELAGCDLLTISPNLLETLQNTSGTLETKLDAKVAKKTPIDRVFTEEPAFRFALNEDPMATEKLAEGIRKFTADTRKLENIVRSSLGQ